MRTDAQRIAKYIAKTAATQVGLKVAARLTGMKSSYAAVANSIVPIETQVQAILNALGAQTTQYPFYYNFARELWSAQNRGVSGASLTAKAVLLYPRYVGYGLTGATLKKIALDVFGVTIP